MAKVNVQHSGESTGSELTVGTPWVRPSESGFVRRIPDWMRLVNTEGRWFLTDFLTPREQYLLHVFTLGLVVRGWGGHPGAERQRMLIMPEDWYPEPEDFHVHHLLVEPAGAASITHGSVLGSCLGTGLQRRKIGDIAVGDNGTAHVTVCADVGAFLRSMWSHVGRTPVCVREADEIPQWHDPPYVRNVISLPSLRLDAVIAHACHWSRSTARQTVESGAVSLNFSVETRPDECAAEGDIVSIRGFGRIKVYQVVGKSRKDRERVEVGVLRSDES